VPKQCTLQKVRSKVVNAKENKRKNELSLPLKSV